MPGFLSSRLSRLLLRLAGRFDPNLRSLTYFPAGSFYSPLLDVEVLAKEPARFLRISLRAWENVDLREADQRALIAQFQAAPTGLPLPAQPTPPWRYHAGNEFFIYADAWSLTQMLGNFRPRRVIEVGSGFSSAVMLDAREHLGLACELTFIEPYPDRLHALLRADDRQSVRILAKEVQDVPIEEFTALAAGDVLFIDSSHVAKTGSDLADLLARVLPALAPGVFVHFHDIFYPGPYPLDWLRQGRAWNEVLFLQAFLQFNDSFRVVLFNAFLGERCPELLDARFRENTGGSFWLRRVG